jgi:hypothetical protein
MANGHDLYPGSGLADELISANAMRPYANTFKDIYRGMMEGRKVALAEDEARRREYQRSWNRQEIDKADALAAFDASSGSVGTTTSSGRAGKAGTAAGGGKPETYTDPSGKTVIGKLGPDGTSPEDILDSMYLRDKGQLYDEEMELSKLKETLGELDVLNEQDRQAAALSQGAPFPLSPQDVVRQAAGSPTTPSSRLGDYAVEGLPGGESRSRPLEDYTTSEVRPMDVMGWDPAKEEATWSPEGVIRSSLRTKRPWGKALGPGEQARTMRKPASSIQPPMPSRGKNIALENVMADPLAPYLPEGTSGPRGNMGQAARMLASRSVSNALGIPGGFLGPESMKILMQYQDLSRHLDEKNDTQAAAKGAAMRDAVALQIAGDKADWIEDLSPELQEIFRINKDMADRRAAALYEKDENTLKILGKRHAEVLAHINKHPELLKIQMRRDAHNDVYNAESRAGFVAAQKDLNNDYTATLASAKKARTDALKLLTEKDAELQAAVSANAEHLGVSPDDLLRAASTGEPLQGVDPDKDPSNAMNDLGALLASHAEAKDGFRDAAVAYQSWSKESGFLAGGRDTTDDTYSTTVQYPDGTSEVITVPSVFSAKREFGENDPLGDIEGHLRAHANERAAVSAKALGSAAPYLLGSQRRGTGRYADYSQPTQADLKALHQQAIDIGRPVSPDFDEWSEGLQSMSPKQFTDYAKLINADHARTVRAREKAQQAIGGLFNIAGRTAGGLPGALMTTTGRMLGRDARESSAEPGRVSVSTKEEVDALAPGTKYLDTTTGVKSTKK